MKSATLEARLEARPAAEEPDSQRWSLCGESGLSMSGDSVAAADADAAAPDPAARASPGTVGGFAPWRYLWSGLRQPPGALSEGPGRGRTPRRTSAGSSTTMLWSRLLLLVSVKEKGCGRVK